MMQVASTGLGTKDMGSQMEKVVKDSSRKVGNPDQHGQRERESQKERKRVI